MCKGELFDETQQKPAASTMKLNRLWRSYGDTLFSKLFQPRQMQVYLSSQHVDGMSMMRRCAAGMVSRIAEPAAILGIVGLPKPRLHIRLC
jgi:hypothetical protein